MVEAMRKKISRSHMDQIVSRVRKAGGKWDPDGKCFVCGKVFHHNSCDHNHEENEQILKMCLES
jgi:uncharacterized Fe-S cluster-containing MiaB family protein